MYKKTVLKNGARIISERLEHLRSISLGIWVDAGSRDEDADENGITHFIEHMIFKGTGTRNSLDIAKELDAIGGLSNAFTGKEQTCFHARVLGRHFHTLADIFSDIFLNSKFEPMDIDRERQVILQEINMVEDTPDDNVHVLFNRFFWKNHPVGLSILGSDNSVSSFDREKLLEYIRKYYTPERIVVAAAGDVDHDTLVEYFGPMLEAVPAGSFKGLRTAPLCHSGVSVHQKDLEQVHICLGGESPSLGSKQRFPCAVLNTILGGNMSSRLFQEIREKQGLAYVIYSFLSAYTDTGLLGIYLATDPDNVNPALATIQKEIRKIRNNDLTPDDLAAAKENLIGGIYLSSESADSRMMRIAKNEFNFSRYVEYEELVSYLEEVKVEDVVEMAHQVFQDNKLNLTILGPVDDKDVDRTLLRMSS